MGEIVSAYSDGGCLGRNPSRLGGTFAWITVDANDEPVAADEGLVLPAEMGTPEVSNNQSELVAAVRCLEALPDGWAGIFYTDSLITLRRVTQPHEQGFANTPDELKQRCLDLKKRLGAFRAVLLGGHPTKAELLAGFRRDGKKVSEWNVFCDQACTRLAKEFMAKRRSECT